MEIKFLKGVGPKRAELYAKLGITTAEELVRLYPKDYIDFTEPAKIRDLQPGETQAFRAVADKKLYYSQYGKTAVYKALLTDGEGEITAVFFNTKYTFDSLALEKEYLFYGKISGDPMHLQVSSPLFLPVDKKGLFPKYPLTAGLTRNMVSANIETALSVLTIEERLPKSIVERYSLMSAQDAVRSIHFPKSRIEYEKARKRLVFEELLSLKLGLARLKNGGRQLSGAVMNDVSLEEFYGSLPFEPTKAQLNAISDCIEDMKKAYPMNRLIQGDVGSGKTLVAAAAAYFAQKNGFQTLVMTPTEVLAGQHYETFGAFLEPLGVRVGLLSGALTAAEKKKVREAALNGEIDVLIGTQALIQKSTVMKRLGLAIVDEQHRFGVFQRSELSEKAESACHVLAMSATPIPRTLALIVYGDLDVSVIGEMPKGRIPVKTYAVDSSYRQRVYAFIKKHISEGYQAFIVCPLVEENERFSEKQSAVKYYEKLTGGDFSGIPTGLLYGKMKQAEKDAVMRDFRDNRLKLLVSTTVIEVGIDVPNAVVMLIENAEQFGLSQLHQLRGRVGRGGVQSYCILMSDSKTDYAAARFKAMCSTTDGYKIADTDLALRGPGNFFGREQHGLPPMKVADLADDAAVLGEIEELSAEIIRKDPNLLLPEHAGLAKSVDELFAKGALAVNSAQ